MSKGNGKTKQNGTVVWCGPTIPGVAKKFDTFNGGIPKALEDAIEASPPIAGLLVSLDVFPDARRALEAQEGQLLTLAHMASVYFTEGG